MKTFDTIESRIERIVKDMPIKQRVEFLKGIADIYMQLDNHLNEYDNPMEEEHYINNNKYTTEED